LNARAPSPRRRAWLELLRLPNLPTVPGDPVAGFALASLGQGRVDWLEALPVAGTALLLYVAGLIWNDCADRVEDGVQRPRRPLPSGRVGLRSAAIVASALAVAGIGLAALAGPGALLFSLLLTALVLTYNFGARRIRVLGVFNMGACRGVSLLMGAAAACSPAQWPPAVLVAATGLALYIAAVTWIAARETEAVRIGAVRWAPLVIGGLVFVLVPAAALDRGVAAGACAAFAVGWLVHYGSALRGTPGPAVVGPSVGGMIRTLVPIQAGLCAAGAFGGVAVAAVLMLAWPASALLAKKFYAS